VTRHNRPGYRHGWRGAIMGIPGASFRAVTPANPPGLVIRPVLRGVARGQCKGGEMTSGVMGCCAQGIDLPVATTASARTRWLGAPLGPRGTASNGPPGSDAPRWVTALVTTRPPACLGWEGRRRRVGGGEHVRARCSGYGWWTRGVVASASSSGHVPSVRGRASRGSPMGVAHGGRPPFCVIHFFLQELWPPEVRLASSHLSDRKVLAAAGP